VASRAPFAKDACTRAAIFLAGVRAILDAGLQAGPFSAVEIPFRGT